MVGELGHHDMGQQSRRRYAFVYYVRWRLDQCFALIADPFPMDVALDGRHAWRVVELLADVLADTLEGGAALALRVIRFVMDQCARKPQRHRCALAFLAYLGRSQIRLHGLQFGSDGGNGGIEQASLCRVELPTALGQAMPFEQHDFVGELFVDCLVVILLVEAFDTRPQLRGQSAQLFDVEIIENVSLSHATDFSRAPKER